MTTTSPRARRVALPGAALAVAALLCSAQVRAAASGTDAAGLYAAYCSVCHGDRGDGRSHASRGLDPPPTDFTAPARRDRLSPGYLRETIANGKPGTAMMAWASRLDETRIAALADFVHESFVAPGPDPAIAAGAAVYARTCSVCHGEDGRGARWGRASLDPPPVDFTGPGLGARLTRERMIRSVTRGRPGTAMMAFATQLDDTRINAVVDHIRGRFMSDDPSSPAHERGGNAATAVGMAVLHGTSPAARHADGGEHGHGADAHARQAARVGEVARGRALYRRNCTACHGVRGDGRGPRAYFIFPRPRNLRTPAARDAFDRQHLIRAISNGVVGREMPAWGKVLDEQQIADLAEYVYAELIHGAGAAP